MARPTSTVSGSMARISGGQELAGEPGPVHHVADHRSEQAVADRGEELGVGHGLIPGGGGSALSAVARAPVKHSGASCDFADERDQLTEIVELAIARRVDRRLVVLDHPGERVGDEDRPASRPRSPARCRSGANCRPSCSDRRRRHARRRRGHRCRVSFRDDFDGGEQVAQAGSASFRSWSSRSPLVISTRR